MSDTVKPEVTGIFGAPKGWYGHHPFYTITRGGSAGEERVDELAPIHYCDGVVVFPCSFEETAELPAAQDYVFKREFRFAANERKINSGSAGGSVFKNLVELLEVMTVTPVNQSIYMRSALSHENYSQVVGIEQSKLVQILEGNYPDTRQANRLITSYGLDLIGRVLSGPDRTSYLHEQINPTSHDSAIRIGHLLIDMLPDDVCTAMSEGSATVRIGDLFAHLGLDVATFRANPIEELEEMSPFHP